MAMTQRSRSVLYQRLTAVTEDEVAVGELLSYYPSRDVEEPATKEFVAARSAEVLAEVADVRAGFSDLRADFSDLRSDVSTQIALLRVEMAAMESRMTANANAQMRASIQWTLGALVSVMALVVAMGFLQQP